jgi:hypothetical protein
MSEKPASKVRALFAPVLALVRLHWIALCVVGGLVLLYTLLGFFLVPYIARTHLTKYVTETLHRQVSLGELRFNPFTFVLDAGDFKLSEADGAPLISFRRLLVNAGLASIWQRSVSLQEVSIEAPEVDVVIARDGSVNLAQLAPPSTAASTEEEKAAPAEAEEPPRVRIDSFSVSEGRVGIEDRTRARPFTAQIKPIRFSLSDFRTERGHENAYRFAGTTQRGERLEWSGRFTVQPLGSRGSFRVEALKLTTLDAYLRESLPFSLSSGEANLDGNYVLVADPLALDVTLPSIAVSKLALAERESGSGEPVRIEQAALSDLAFSYGKRELGLKLVEVTGAHVDVLRDENGNLNLARLAGAASESSAPPTNGNAPDTQKPSKSAANGSTSPDWFVHLDTVRVNESTVVAEDRSVSPAVRMEVSPIALTVANWSTRKDARLDVDLGTTINKNARVTAKGTVQLEPVDAKVAIDIADFALPLLQPYVAQATAMTVHSGKLGAKGDVALRLEDPDKPAVGFKGEVRVADLRTTDQLVDADFIKWRGLAVTGIDFALNPDQLAIERIVAQQPYANVIIAQDTTLNIASVLRTGGPEKNCDASAADCEPAVSPKAQDKAAAPKGQDKSAAQSVMPVRIRNVQVIDGSANFADYSIAPSFAAGILELNGSVTGLSSDPASRATVKLAGKVDKYAPVDISGQVNLLAAAKYTDLAMNFRNMELTTFNPYSGKFAGYNISKGKLSTELKYKVQDRKLDAQHHIVVDNMEFGDKTDSKDAAPIPVKLAVALLKDRNGVIDVNLPVSGTLDDPKFRLGPIIWKALLGLLTKIVTAPFAALGALFGGGEELAFIDFQPGSAELSATEAAKLESLAKALAERPQLRLDVPVTFVEEADGEALARKAFEAQVAGGADAPLDEAAKAKRVAELEAAYKVVAKVAPVYPADAQPQNPDARLAFLAGALLTQLKPDAAALTALGRDRARAVQDALLKNTEINAERVFITTERTPKAEKDAVRMEMKLE